MRQHLQAIVILGAGLLAVAAPSAANDHWDQGLTAFGAEDFKTAAWHFESVTKTNPSWAGGYFMLGRCQRHLGNTAEAIELLTKAHELDPSDGNTVIALGDVLISENRREQAMTALDALPEENRSQVTGQLASVLLKQGRSLDAEAILMDRVAEDNGDPMLFRLLGLAQKARGAAGPAFESFSRSFALDPDQSSGKVAVQLAFAMAAKDPDNDQGWSDRARQAAEALADAFPTAENQRSAGQAALAAGDPEAAEQRYRAALKLDESDAQSLYFLGRALVAMDQDLEAEQAFSQALTLEPASTLSRSIHGQMGRLAACRLELTDAADHYRSADRSDRAAEIDALAEQFSGALAQLDQLKKTIAELRTMEQELEALGDEQGVAAMRERAASHRNDVNAIEANLDEVRSALCW